MNYARCVASIAQKLRRALEIMFPLVAFRATERARNQPPRGAEIEPNPATGKCDRGTVAEDRRAGSLISLREKQAPPYLS